MNTQDNKRESGIFSLSLSRCVCVCGVRVALSITLLEFMIENSPFASGAYALVSMKANANVATFSARTHSLIPADTFSLDCNRSNEK